MPKSKRGQPPTVRNPGIDFLNFRHPTPRQAPYGGEASIVTNRHKLIVSPKGQPVLYDVVEDPYETKDLAGTEPQLLKELTQKLRQWQASVENSLTGADYK